MSRGGILLCSVSRVRMSCSSLLWLRLIKTMTQVHRIGALLQILTKTVSVAPRCLATITPSLTKVPLGDVSGNPMLAMDMWYYVLLEKLR